MIALVAVRGKHRDRKRREKKKQRNKQNTLMRKDFKWEYRGREKDGKGLLDGKEGNSGSNGE